MSPAATTLLTAVSFVDDEGVERYGFVQVPADAPGVAVNGDWDALGMRASGSHSITLSGVELPAGAVRGGFPTGETVPYLDRNMTSGLFHASASLGIAEAAFARVAVPERVARRRAGARCSSPSRRSTSPPRAASSPARRRSSTSTTPRTRPTTGSDDEVVAVFSEGQAAKAFVVDAADARRRPRPRALGRRGLPQRLAARPRVSRRPRRSVHAPARRQPRYGFLARTALGLRPQLT